MEFPGSLHRLEFSDLEQHWDGHLWTVHLQVCFVPCKSLWQSLGETFPPECPQVFTDWTIMSSKPESRKGWECQWKRNFLFTPQTFAYQVGANFTEWKKFLSCHSFFSQHLTWVKLIINILNFMHRFISTNMSRVTFHVSCFRCHMSNFTCQMSCVTCHI